MRCAVIGGGAWGSALAHLLAQGGHETCLWAREADVAAHLNLSHANPRFLPGATLDARIHATTDMAEALGGAQLVLYVAPSHVLRGVVRGAAHRVEPGALAVVATKGIERGTLALMTDVVRQELPQHGVVAVSGPSFALEVARGMPTAVVAASDDPAAAAAVQRVLSSPVFRVYSNDDVVGVEVGGALKNVMAVATGIAEGVGLGLNSRAALITRGLAEMTRLGVALGARPETFAGLAGMGDLVLTCTGALSRNRAVGLEVGQGRALADVLAATESVAEGITTTDSARALAEREGVDMPIVRAISRILFEQQAPRDALADLMGRELRPERDA
ncbi:MAG: NAD(P)-dependent glycerol-3-phosphate dehydrogenase [Gemmatimonadetes bacterium]|nr:NAD(P)-dependent glycerol-3-phosphate dehydrogenase [Gemmatimonadota bacterium]